MAKTFSFFLIYLAFLVSPPSEAKKRRRKIRKWSVSTTNGYTFHQRKKDAGSVSTFGGQMDAFFSSFEMTRNFGHYEVGLRLQQSQAVFASPFVKFNFIKNRRRNDFVPFMILGVSPSALLGVYARVGLNLFFYRYFSLSPFVGSYVWFKNKIRP